MNSAKIDLKITINLKKSAKTMYKYIIFDPDILGGKPIIKDTRLSVAFINELFASEATMEEILMSYPQLNRKALEEAIQYSAEAKPNQRS